MSEQYSSALASGRRLATAILNTDTSLVLSTIPTDLAPGRYRLRIGGELLTGDYTSGTLFTTLQRGIEGTAATGHRAGELVRHVITGDSLQRLVTIQDTDNVVSLDGVRTLVVPNGALTVRDRTATLSVAGADAGFSVVLDGGDAQIQAGTELDVQLPWDLTLTGVTLLADQTGSIELDIWLADYASYPPTSDNSICASSLPTLSSAIKSTNALVGWTTVLLKGSVLRVHVNAADTVGRVAISCTGTRTVSPQGYIFSEIANLTAAITGDSFINEGVVVATLPNLTAALS